MNKRSLKTWTTAALIAAFLSPVLAPPSAQAAPDSGPSAYINSGKAYGSVLIREGNTFVTLTDLKNLGSYSFRYDKANQQVTISTKGTQAVLTIGSKTLQINDKKTTLPVAPFLYKGKTMMPLRAVSEAFGAKIYWNGPAKTAYIAKPDAKVIADLKSGNLTTARNAALQVPIISSIPKPSPEMTYMEMQGVNYYFPKGKADKYFEVDNDLASYYEIRNNIVELKWQAKLDYAKGKNAKSGIFFLSHHFVKEIGKQPDVNGWTVAEFKFRYPVGVTTYRLLNGKGEISGGFAELDNQSPSYQGVIVEIPEESGTK
ncbi:copper amine oxidase N-terminal domain-containing protein [Paenibacillus sp. DMB20]|uniref:copper amine oxidase N-terminal domain-containing protein n=1 Tax=Paenibacillus sp. DMB20 TaxID=1642570 RepID=UPI00062811E4|nr:copper amine oxidase N-terminal domain-containing protein [Paenibacillus sp. DMB20]KKO52998.1 hypothetical protein XI25_17690 [Paenibacillus sp. DMB20]KKO53508.1 hypothetical protein XI25_10780 [Paenibacillus sp. DMB20]